MWEFDRTYVSRPGSKPLRLQCLKRLRECSRHRNKTLRKAPQRSFNTELSKFCRLIETKQFEVGAARPRSAERFTEWANRSNPKEIPDEKIAPGRLERHSLARGRTRVGCRPDHFLCPEKPC